MCGPTGPPVSDLLLAMQFSGRRMHCLFKQANKIAARLPIADSLFAEAGKTVSRYHKLIAIYTLQAVLFSEMVEQFAEFLQLRTLSSWALHARDIDDGEYCCR